jgi:di/tripeptidase
MVLQKDEGVAIDMEKEPIDVTHDGTMVYAKGTTLGADDGIGIAMILALMEDPDAKHPPLEIIITSEEEVGLLGANAIDLSQLRGKRMLNLDTHNEKVLNAGCAGGTGGAGCTGSLRLLSKVEVGTAALGALRLRLFRKALGAFFLFVVIVVIFVTVGRCYVFDSVPKTHICILLYITHHA